MEVATINATLAATDGVRRNVAGRFYTIKAVRRTPSKQRRSTGQPWQFWAEFDNNHMVPDWYPASTQTISEIVAEAE